MYFLRHLPIRQKMVFVILLTCGATVLLAGISLFGFQTYLVRRTFERDLKTLASIVADNCVGPVVFNDRQAALDVLATLRPKSQIVAATIRLRDQSIFAKLGEDRLRPESNPSPAILPNYYENDQLVVSHPIRTQRELLGVLTLRGDFRPTYLESWRLFLSVLAVVGIGALLVALLLATLLQRVVTRPIHKLADVARRIAQEKDYSVRAELMGTDEVGLFTQAFNHMLDRIEADDAALRRAKATLEQEVQERRRAEDALKERVRLETLTAEVGWVLTRNLDLMRTLQDCCTTLVRQLDVAFARIWTLDASAGVLELKASAGCYTHLDGAHARIRLGEFKIGRIAQSGQAHLTNQVGQDPQIHDRAWAQREGMVAFAGYPLLMGGRVSGVIGVFARRALSQAEFQAISSVANALALGLERKRAEVALQESEERFRTVVENSTVGLYRTTPAGRVLMANPALQEMLGYDSFEELVRLDLAQESYADPAERQRFQTRIEAEGEIRGAEGRWRRRDGRVIFIRESAKAIRDAAGQVLYYEGTVEDITARKEAELELQRLNRELMAASRYAGMAEVASGVLHNVGNVLNSVNVSATLLADQVARSKIQSLVKAVALLRDHQSDVGDYLSRDPKGQLLPGFLLALADHLAREQRAWQEELKGLTRNVEHIKEIVAMQQSYARVAGVTEVLEAQPLLEDALQLNEAGLRRHQVEILRDYEEVPRVAVDKHKVLQILVNLIRNAKYALDHAAAEGRRLKLGISRNGSRFVRIVVEDNGVGIAPENLTRIFAHGFTTKKDGHGFGLHSGALAAREMGGALTAHSDGPGRGARFTLSLPIAEERTLTS